MSDLSKMRIMVVDDVKANLDILIETLANNYKVSVAMDGASAIEDIKVNLPDLILLDIVMPDINGYDVCKRLKADPATENIPIIFVTSKSNEADETKGLELGAVDYITKPFSPSIVKARIRTHLSLIGARQALAKQNEQMKHSLSLAMEVQQNLIPQSAPKIDGFDIAGKIIYCDETGGDYFDYIEIKEDQLQKLGIAVGDVSEHGIPSALLMTTARALIRHRLTFPGTLATIISDVNHQFSEDVKESGRFMTLFFCCLDPAEQSISWVRAGHDPAIIYSPDSRRFENLEGKGMPLGVLKDVVFEEQCRELQPGQILLIYTDGIWEAKNNFNEFFGKERLKKTIKDHYMNTAREILETIFKSLETFTPLSQIDDDLTAVVIKVL